MIFYIAWDLNAAHERKGTIDVRNGALLEVESIQGSQPTANEIVLTKGKSGIFKVTVEVSATRYGKNATLVHWKSEQGGFSFLPLEIPKKGRINAPDLGVRIALSLEALDHAAEIKPSSHDLPLPKGREIGWEIWEKENISLKVPTVLGLSRDQRVFIFDEEEDTIRGSIDLGYPELVYSLGRASYANIKARRSLDEGALPILHMTQRMGDILIEDCLFASYGDRPLNEATLTGTPIDAAHYFSRNSTFPPGEMEKVASRIESPELQSQGDVVLYVSTRLTNLSSIPKLAPIRFPYPYQLNKGKVSEKQVDLRITKVPATLDENGVLWLEGVAYARYRMDGKVPDSLQPTLLLEPGESFQVESMLAHGQRGLSEASQRSAASFSEKLEETRRFWKEKLHGYETVYVPDARLNAFWKAGANHLELVTLGEKEGPLLPKVGIYSAIGTESIPIVEFYDSTGQHELARRCIDVFYHYQHASGRINVYDRYDAETGAVLYLTEKHFAYQQDRAWIKSLGSKIQKAADYLISFRKVDDPESLGYGFIQGTNADVVPGLDEQSAFMLNAFSAVGLQAAARLLKEIDHDNFAKYEQKAKEYTQCFKDALSTSFAKGPLLPVDHDHWVPTGSAWTEGIGPVVLGLQGEAGFTHRTYFCFEALVGSTYAPYTGLTDPNDRQTDWMLAINKTNYNRGAVAESQPYYSRHPELHLLRGEHDDFLNAFYSGITSLADRETFTFWEHYWKVSVHKTHEEGWALMQMRRMLWIESGRTLQLLAGIPEAWLDADQSITIKNGGSYFGDFSFSVQRSVDGKFISLTWDPKFHATPDKVIVHFPGLESKQSVDTPDHLIRAGKLEIKEPMKAQKIEITIEARRS